MSTPRSVRLAPDVRERLSAYAAARPGLSVSAAISQLVDEGLRMQQHRGVVFREGPMGRRAALAAGPDVWEVVRALRQVKENEPHLDEQERVAVVAENTGLASRQIEEAVAYWSEYPDEVDRLLTAAEAAEASALDAWERRTELLS